MTTIAPLQASPQPTSPAASTNGAAAISGPIELIGLDRTQIAEHLAQLEVPQRQINMRVAQLWHWLYVRGAKSFSEMSNVAMALRLQLADYFTITYPQIVEDKLSIDGTRKWLLRFASTDPRIKNHIEVETVYIPQEDRGTLCVSSQVGCTLNCSFCHTGTQPLVRNLTAHEILAQLLLARDLLGDFPGDAVPMGAVVPSEGRRVSNIVMMGMGEPLYNFANVKQALLIARDCEGLSLSRRRITLSTSGVVPMIVPAGAEIGVMLAISLHAVQDDVRNMLVPINKKYPIAQLLEACRNYPGLSNAKRITFEYVMLRDINDSLADAKKLVSLLRDIPAKINLIPFNPWPGSNYECSSEQQIAAFAQVITKGGYPSPIRAPRGQDIFAACGQLKSASQKIRASDGCKS